ncbi:hypothetical protein SAMN05421867_10443 [Cellulomonas marina]|uniref:Uncharacterized protein n=2 Tax=Cellulomonas marina TaxID=988821 RepID=A0A1I0X0T8_9CELL|nr:hypothetical protein SAMN05421867_10443 [Cellulomonas marina]
MYVAADGRWGHYSRLLNPDAEFAVPAAWNALLLIVAAGFSALLSRRVTRLYVWLAVGLLVMAIDETLAVHEGIERALGVDWQVLYAPLALGALVLALRLVTTLWRRDRRTLPGLLAVGSCWLFSQVLEAFEWRGAVQMPHYAAMMLVEEALETSGSAVLVLTTATAWLRTSSASKVT